MHRDSKQATERLLLHVVDFSLAGVIFLVPLLMGGRHPIGQLALTVLAVAAALAWAARQSLRDDATWRPAAATPLLLLAAALVGLQIVPLPPWLLARLAPHTARLLPLWNADGTTPGSLGYWPYLSVTPAETRAGLVIFLDFALLFLVAVQRIRRIEDVERLLRWCARLGRDHGVVRHRATARRKRQVLLVLRTSLLEHFRRRKGSFTNRNHFAQFLALGVGPLIWWLQDAMRRTRGSVGFTPFTRRVAPAHHAERQQRRKASGSFYLLSLAFGVVMFAGLLSLSRGGIAAMFLAAAVSAAICYRTASLGRRLLGVLAAAGVLIGVSLAIFGFDRVNVRLETLSSGSLDKLDEGAGRRIIWAAALKAIPNSLLWGTGVGSFAEVYPMYTGFAADHGVEYTHAENSYLQDAVETGVIGLALTLAGMVLCAAWCISGIRHSSAHPFASVRRGNCRKPDGGGGPCHGRLRLVRARLHGDRRHSRRLRLRVRQMARGEERAARSEERAVGGRGPGFRFIQSTISNRQSPIPLSPLLSPLSSLRWAWAAGVVTLACLGAWMIADRIGPAVAQTYWDEYLIARHIAEAQPSAQQNPLAEAVTQQRHIACLENVLRWQPTHARAQLALAECDCRLFEALQTAVREPDVLGPDPRCRDTIAVSVAGGPGRMAVARRGKPLDLFGPSPPPRSRRPGALSRRGPRLRLFGRPLVSGRSR